MLARIETLSGVREAWLSWDGTTLIVIPQPGADPSSAIEQAFGAGYVKDHLLAGAEREAALRSFSDRKRWVRHSTAYLLSDEEARIVADRVVERVSAQVTLPSDAADKLREAVRRRFFDAYAPSDRDTWVEPATVKAAIEADAAAFLDAEGQAALHRVLEAGWKPDPKTANE